MRVRATLAGVVRAHLLVGLVALAPSSVRADVISEPPSCPPDSEAVFCHGPPTCAPRECLSSRECAAGEHCALSSLCVETHGCGGIGGGAPQTHVLGACGPSDRCASGTCSGLFVCTTSPTEVETGGTDASGVDAGDGRTHVQYHCACRVGGPGTARSTGGSHGAFAAGLGMLLVAGVRIRRRARREFPNACARGTLDRA